MIIITSIMLDFSYCISYVMFPFPRTGDPRFTTYDIVIQTGESILSRLQRPQTCLRSRCRFVICCQSNLCLILLIFGILYLFLFASFVFLDRRFISVRVSSQISCKCNTIMCIMLLFPFSF